MKNIKKPHIKYGDIQIKQHSKMKYLRYILDETMSAETTEFNFVNKIYNKLNFF